MRKVVSGPAIGHLARRQITVLTLGIRGNRPSAIPFAERSSS